MEVMHPPWFVPAILSLLSISIISYQLGVCKPRVPKYIIFFILKGVRAFDMANSCIQYTASAKTSSLDATEKSLQTLKDLLDKDPKLVTIISSPTLNAQGKSVIVTEITKKIPSDKTVKNLLEVLAENNRLGLLGSVIDKYATLMNAHKGEIEVVVTSASVMSP